MAGADGKAGVATWNGAGGACSAGHGDRRAVCAPPVAAPVAVATFNTAFCKMMRFSKSKPRLPTCKQIAVLLYGVWRAIIMRRYST